MLRLGLRVQDLGSCGLGSIELRVQEFSFGLRESELDPCEWLCCFLGGMGVLCCCTRAPFSFSKLLGVLGSARCYAGPP